MPGSMYRRRCFFAGYERPREEREALRERAAVRAKDREMRRVKRGKGGGGEEKDRENDRDRRDAFLVHPSVISTFRIATPEGIRRNARARTRVVRLVRPLPHCEVSEVRESDASVSFLTRSSRDDYRRASVRVRRKINRHR